MAIALPAIVLPSLLIALGATGLGAFALRASQAMHGGKFEAMQSAPGAFRFRSDFGEFGIDRGRASLRVAGDTQVATVPLAPVVTVAVRTVDALAPAWLEFVLGAETFELFEHSGARVDWHVVVIALDDGREVPVFAVSQAHRAAATSKLHGLVVATLHRLGIVPDALACAQRVRAEVARHCPVLIEVGEE
jgi:hypothetical protein